MFAESPSAPFKLCNNVQRKLLVFKEMMWPCNLCTFAIRNIKDLFRYFIQVLQHLYSVIPSLWLRGAQQGWGCLTVPPHQPSPPKALPLASQ